jgi:hypothetical protein
MPGSPPELNLSFPDDATLRAEFDKNLRKARIFVPGAEGISERSRCVLLLCRPGGGQFRLQAEAVYVKPDEPGKGIGLSLDPFDAGVLADLQAFVDGAPPIHNTPPEEHDGTHGEDPEGKIDASPGAQSLQERIRRLTAAEQQKMASHGGMQERLLLERTFGPTVWEALLSNPRITPPEVARIARKGALPRPVIETIASNNAWAAAPEVQRALLSNPRTGSHLIPKLLRALSRSDLALVPTQSAYPAAVRAAAKKMLQG